MSARETHIVIVQKLRNNPKLDDLCTGRGTISVLLEHSTMNFSFFRWALVVLVLFCRSGDGQYIANSIRNLVYNTVGTPEVHQKQQWVFDPDAGSRRAARYQQVNGRLGELAIERLGLGVDGRESERLQQQRLRDEGHLGGLNAYLP